MFWCIVGIVIGVVVLWFLVEVVKEIRVIREQYICFVDYLLEKGAKRVVLVPPKRREYGLVRLYDREGVFIEELIVGREDWWFVWVIVSELRRDGFEVGVGRI